MPDLEEFSQAGRMYMINNHDAMKRTPHPQPRSALLGWGLDRPDLKGRSNRRPSSSEGCHYPRKADTWALYLHHCASGSYSFTHGTGNWMLTNNTPTIYHQASPAHKVQEYPLKEVKTKTQLPVLAIPKLKIL
jgi:hypothetical protein